MSTIRVFGVAGKGRGRFSAAGSGLAWLFVALMGCAPVEEIDVEQGFEVVDVGTAPVPSDEESNVAEAEEALTSLGYSTFFGGNSHEEGAKPAVDAAGNVYLAGSVSVVNKGWDIFVRKYSPTGVWLWSATFGGTGNEEVADIAVDGVGRVFVLAKTTSYGASKTILVAKLNAAGNALVYHSRFGGSVDDRPHAIAIDAAGNAYIAGETYSADFPRTAGTFQTTRRAGSDAFVSKLNASGNALVYSTLLGGDGEDKGSDIAVDASGNAYVAGSTLPFAGGLEFPTTTLAYQKIPAGSWDAFVAKLTPSATSVDYSTLLGGSASDTGFGIGVDGARNAYVTGLSLSGNFPTTPGAFRPYKSTSSLDEDAFVTKLNESGSALSYSTFVGGGGAFSQTIAVGGTGKVYVGGTTSMPSFPATSNGFQQYHGAGDGYLMELNPLGSSATFATFLGGTGSEIVLGVAVDSNGNAYAAGRTTSPDFPIFGAAAQPTFGGVVDAFLVRINGP